MKLGRQLLRNHHTRGRVFCWSRNSSASIMTRNLVAMPSLSASAHNLQGPKVHTGILASDFNPIEKFDQGYTYWTQAYRSLWTSSGTDDYARLTTVWGNWTHSYRVVDQICSRSRCSLLRRNNASIITVYSSKYMRRKRTVGPVGMKLHRVTAMVVLSFEV